LQTALLAGRTAALASRLSGRGSGASIRGKITTKLDPKAFAELIASRRIAAVTGTNGKTTTTHLLTAAVRAGLDDDGGQVVTNADGANLHHGIVSALGEAPQATTAILETDERVVADTVRLGHPEILVLLNFSRDQLDRNHELAFLGRDWRSALAAAGPDGPMVIANSADPLIVWVCQRARAVVWVDTKPRWTADSTLCPNCGGVLIHETDSWHCPDCPLAQPEADWWVDGEEAVSRKGDRHHLDLQVPGHFNLTNATCALAAAVEMGISPDDALAGMRTVSSPAGRYATTTISGTKVRLLLSKNPAGWTESLPLTASDPLVLAIDAVAADGKDVSWLWDVDYEQLAGRMVICTGPRALDLAVRLDYAGVDHVVIEDLAEALDSPLLAGHWDDDHPIDVLSTYTPFQKLRRLGGLA
jgi:UDP-N-acetylmuramyl tripeptide synthase